MPARSAWVWGGWCWVSNIMVLIPLLPIQVPMKWFPSELLTLLQIAQMVVGVVVVSYSWYSASLPGV